MARRPRTTIVLLALSIAVLLTGCNNPPFREGEVLEKQHEGSSTYIVMMPIISGKTTTFVPIIFHDDEDFIFIVLGTTDDGKEKTAKVYVDAETWERLSVGDWWSMDESREAAFEDKDQRGERAD